MPRKSHSPEPTESDPSLVSTARDAVVEEAKTRSKAAATKAATRAIGAKAMGGLTAAASLTKKAEKVDGATDAKDALSQIATGAAQGAVAGAGLPGALVGAAKGAGSWLISSRRGRKLIAAVVLLLAAPSLIFGSLLVIGLVQASSVGSGAQEQEDQEVSAETVTQDIDAENSEIVSYVDAGAEFGVPWQIMASISTGSGSTAASGSSGSGSGPVSLLTDAVCPATPFTEVEAGLQDTALSALRCVHRQFPTPTTFHGLGERGNDSDHPFGYGLDVMVPDWDTDAGRNLGWEIARWFAANSETLQVTYLVWDAKFWNGGEEWDTYNRAALGETDPTRLHLDHLHISFVGPHRSTPAATPFTNGGQLTPTDFTSPTPAPTSSPSPSPTIDLPNPGPTLPPPPEEGSTPDPVTVVPPTTVPSVPAAGAAQWSGELTFTPEAEVPETARTSPESALIEIARQLGAHVAGSDVGELADGALALSGGLVRDEETGDLLVPVTAEDATGAEGEVVDDDAAAHAATVRATWTEAIAALPLVGMNDQVASSLFDRALDWYMGKPMAQAGAQCIPGTGSTPGTGNPGGGVPATLEVTTADGRTFTLDSEQLTNAQTIHATVIGRGLPVDVSIIALMTAAQESKFKNLDSGDRDSLGLFQQRPSAGWGTREQILDPIYATGKFLDSLVALDWQSMTKNDAAQAVQSSGHPDLYGAWEPVARAILAALGENVPGVTCSSGTVGDGTWTHPLPGARFTSKYGFRGAIASAGVAAGLHNGSDLAMPVGTPILAAGSGTVSRVIHNGKTSDALYGVSGTLVAVDHGEGTVTTYNHMQADTVAVQVGQAVNAGDVVGYVGMTGRTGGPHLHFTVHINGKSTDPEPFMKERCVDLRRPDGAVPGCTPPGGTAPASGDVAAAIEFARSQTGKTYLLGAVGPDKWDCSSLVQAAFAKVGKTLPRTTREQWKVITPVTADQLVPGDLVFWSNDNTAGGIYHVAIYTGPGTVVHAANPDTGIVEGKLYTTNIFGYGRVS